MLSFVCCKSTKSKPVTLIYRKLAVQGGLFTYPGWYLPKTFSYLGKTFRTKNSSLGFKERVKGKTKTYTSSFWGKKISALKKEF